MTLVIALLLAQTLVTEPCTSQRCGRVKEQVLTARGVTLENATPADGIGCVPLITTGGVRRWLVLTRDSTPIECWVAATMVKQTLIGVLDIQVEGTGPSVKVVRSVDHGRSWSLVRQVEKPHRLAQVKSLEATSSNDWRITLVLDETAEGVAAGSFEASSTGTSRIEGRSRNK